MLTPAEAADQVRAIPGRRVKFSNLEKVFFPATETHGPLAKAHLVLYYHALRDRVLPYLRDRPLVMRRYPNGITGDWFYTKDWPERERFPEFAERVAVYSETREERMHYVVANSADALLWLPQLGCIDFHPWLSKLGEDWASCGTEQGLAEPACGLDYPDQLVLDIDPYLRAGRVGRKGTEAGGEPGLDPEDWAAAVRVAHLTRELLDDLGLASYLKTSGKRGLHLYVPLEQQYTYEQVRAFAKGLGARLVRRHYDLLTLKYDLKARAGKVFFDYNQNVRGKTLAAPFCLRPTPEATVSMPIDWSDLDRVRPEQFTVLNVPQLVEAHGDPWGGLREAQHLPQLPATP